MTTINSETYDVFLPQVWGNGNFFSAHLTSFMDVRNPLIERRIVLSNLQINALLNDLLANPQCGFSCGGVNVWGDDKSIKAVRQWHHDSTAVVPALHERIGGNA